MSNFPQFVSIMYSKQTNDRSSVLYVNVQRSSMKYMNVCILFVGHRKVFGTFTCLAP